MLPRAGRDKVLGVYDGRLKMAVAAAPVEGEATARCRSFLAELFGVPLQRVSLLNGAQSRNKAFRFSGMTVSECRKSLGRILGEP